MIPLPQMLSELIMALGGALFVANVLVLVRRPTGEPPRRAAEEDELGAAGEEPSDARVEAGRPRAPSHSRPSRGKAIASALLGFVVLAWGFASLLARR